MKKKLIILFAFFLIGYQSSAGHLAGGQFHVVRIDSLNYQLSLELLYDDSHVTWSPNINSQTVYARGVYNNYLNNVGVFNLYSQSVDTVTFTNNCLSGTKYYINQVYSATVTLPNWAMTIPNGVLFDFSGCCVAGFANSWLPGSSESVMYHVADLGGAGSGAQAYPIQGKARPFGFCRLDNNSYSWGASDPDGDSLAFGLYPFRNNPGGGQDVVAGEVVTTSVPGVPPISINQQTGSISGSTSNVGTYGFGQKVKEYRNGNLLSVSYRFVPLVSMNCTMVNASPVRTALSSTGWQNSFSVGDTVGAFSGLFNIPFYSLDQDLTSNISWKVESKNIPASDIFLIKTADTSYGAADTLWNEVLINLTKAVISDTLLIISSDTNCQNQFRDTLRLTIIFANPSNAGIGVTRILPVNTFQYLNLFPMLQGNPNPGGQWVDIDFNGLIRGGDTFYCAPINLPSVYRAAYIQQEPNYPPDTAIMILDFRVGVGLGVEFQKEAKVFPNPAGNSVEVTFHGKEKLEFFLYNSEGILVKRQFLRSGEKILLESLPPGQYILRSFSLDPVRLIKQ